MRLSPTLPTFISAGQGDAPPLVLLHGIGSTATGWRPPLAELAHARRVLAWNAPGYADSAPLDTPEPLVEDYAQVLLALLDDQRIDSAVLVASSWGTPIAIAAAAMWPDRIAQLVLSGPTAGYGSLPPAEREQLLQTRAARAQARGVAAMLEDDAPRLVAPGTPEAVRAGLAQARQGVHLAGYLQALHALAHADAVAALARVRCPVLIVAGGQDVIAPPAQHALPLSQALPGTPLHLLEGCGHLPHAEQAAVFAALTRQFIEPDTQPKETSPC